ncbi:kinase-like domain-containing protein [Pisolithus orientalis]|uniref:kinase-like domain-containing protein n=1 Tax=Pisolithus orientalis TaxID=936130 RepID=UPI00222476B6|nr:kinase-like domain-containing protein [Pisolithus orientalis]KAI6002631.1 kinase-like domain-containing protein [Pisolithus orientalis]
MSTLISITLDNDIVPQLLDIASGLCYLHSLHIAHGDMKGPNVLISEARRALITDFGFSRLTNPPPSLQVDPPCGGSLPWMAPERLNTPTPSSTQADVWAFGMTVLELFSRKNPFHEVRTKWGVMSRIVEGRLPDRPSDESTSFRLCDSWWNICLECWEYDPVQRPAMNDIVARVEKLNEGTGRADGGKGEGTGGEGGGRRLWLRVQQLGYLLFQRGRDRR